MTMMTSKYCNFRATKIANRLHQLAIPVYIVILAAYSNLTAQSGDLYSENDGQSYIVDYYNDALKLKSNIGPNYYSGNGIHGYGGRFVFGPEIKKAIHLGLGGDWGCLGNGFLFGVSANAIIHPRTRLVFPYALASVGYAYESLILNEADWNFFFNLGGGIGAPVLDRGYQGINRRQLSLRRFF
jgi:hypothetical protein